MVNNEDLLVELNYLPFSHLVTKVSSQSFEEAGENGRFSDELCECLGFATKNGDHPATKNMGISEGASSMLRFWEFLQVILG